MVVREWLHAHHKRLVKIRFGPEQALHMVDRKGDKLRTISFQNIDCVNVEESAVSIIHLNVSTETPAHKHP